jgi:hypothetical protein
VLNVFKLQLVQGKVNLIRIMGAYILNVLKSALLLLIFKIRKRSRESAFNQRRVPFFYIIIKKIEKKETKPYKFATRATTLYTEFVLVKANFNRSIFASGILIFFVFTPLLII